MSDFAWLERGATPDLADLGKRIAGCIRKHGYTEQSWLVSRIHWSINTIGVARLQAIFERAADGVWSQTEWRPA